MTYIKDYNCSRKFLPSHHIQVAENPMLRIAMISYHTCPLATLGGKDTGGMNVYVRELTRQLGKMGIHVDVFTRSQDDHVPHVLHELGYGNRVVHVPAGPEHPLPKKELANYIPEFVDGVNTFAQEKGIRYDIIHSHYWMSGLAAASLSDLWAGTPIVNMFHTLGEMKNRVAQSEAEREGEYRIDGEKQVIRRANRVVVATLAEMTQLRFLYKAEQSKMVVIPPGVDLGHFYPIPSDEAKLYVGLKPEDRMVLFVGRIERLKGVDTLIHAMCCLQLKDISRPVHLAYFYSAAEVLVMPSHYESFGMVALEAMACGTPVIASEVGGLAYLVRDGETGFTIPAEEPDTLCEKLTWLLTDGDLHAKMSRQAAEYAKDYAWENIAKQVVEVYNELL